MNLNLEKESVLSSQDRYDIIHFAQQSAVEEGFCNKFLFLRALYLYAAIILDEEHKEELQAKISEDLLGTWDYAIKENIISNMLQSYPKEMELLADESQQWFEEYIAWSKSLRGVVDVFQNYSADIMQQAAAQLQNIENDSSLGKVIDIANKWGMNNDTSVSEKSLFTK